MKTTVHQPKRKFRKPYRFTPGVKGFFSLKYRKKFYDYHEFNEYDGWQKRKQAYKRSYSHNGMDYPARIYEISYRKINGVKKLKRPFTKYFRKKNDKY